MLTKRICLVLGAGASQPYGLPTGEGLLKSVFDAPPEDWWPLATAIDKDRAYHDHFVDELRRSGRPSLDEFVGKLQHFKRYAKALIAFHIGQAERGANLLARAGDWQNFLTQRIADGADLEDLDQTPISVVTFNFDRSFEEGLLVRLSSMYRREGESDSDVRARVATAIGKWEIVHVHGKLGELPELAAPGAPCRPYEPSLEPRALEYAIDGIKLLDDADPSSAEFARAGELIRGADLVLFLGYAFHRLNCGRLLPKRWGPHQRPQMFGTSFHMLAGAVAKGRSYFENQGPKPELFDVDCLGLLQRIEDRFSE